MTPTHWYGTINYLENSDMRNNMNTPPSRVFVTQEVPDLNYLPAEQFGEIVFLTRDDISPVKNSLHNEALISSVRSKLADFNPEVDFITASGSPVVAAIVFMILAEKVKALNMLRWSNRDHFYQQLFIKIK